MNAQPLPLKPGDDLRLALEEAGEAAGQTTASTRRTAKIVFVMHGHGNDADGYRDT